MKGSLLDLQWAHQMKPTQMQIYWGRRERIQTLPLVSDFCSSAMGLGAHKLSLPIANFLLAPHIWYPEWGRWREPVSLCGIRSFSLASASHCWPVSSGNIPVTCPSFVVRLNLSPHFASYSVDTISDNPCLSWGSLPNYNKRL